MGVQGLIDGLEAAVRSVDKLNVYPKPPGDVSPPGVIISIANVERDDMDSGLVVDFELAVLVSSKNADKWPSLTALVELDTDGSVSTAVESDPTLGGRVGSTKVLSVGQYGLIEIGNVSYYGAIVKGQALL